MGLVTLAIIAILVGAMIAPIVGQTTGQTTFPITATTLDTFQPPVTFFSNLTGILSGQSFTITGRTWQIASVTFLMNQSMAWQGSIVAEIWMNTGTPGAGATPTPATGGAIATSTTVLTTAGLQTGPAIPFTFGFPPNTQTLLPGNYWAVLDSSSVPPNVPSGPKAWYNGTFAGHNRAFFNPPPPTWTPLNNQNLWFIVTGQFISSFNINNSPGTVPVLLLFPLIFAALGLGWMWKHGQERGV